MVPKDEDMRAYVRELNPSRWKVFQCLLLENENGGAEAGDLRDARPFLITDNEFKVNPNFMFTSVILQLQCS